MRNVFDQHRPHVVFHAAAYKHVPMLELQPWEAVFNNIISTKNVLALCNEFEETKRFVLVSSDKAVRPTNVMGTTKRIAELLTQHYDVLNHHTTHQSVRFGNVVGSAGSVIPLFKKQIEKGGPVTVTHPEVTRYFMTIPEAAQLILQAGAMGEGGEIFVLEMGTPVKIMDLARDLIRLSGYEPDEDIPIEVVGLRPGEKLFEELITSGEGIVPTEHEKIMVLKADHRAAPGAPGLFTALDDDIAELVELSRRQDGVGIRTKLQQMVPEYVPSEHDTSSETAKPPQVSSK
jgi:FlaA1/EpsC-like NDP-sugar epimerase